MKEQSDDHPSPQKKHPAIQQNLQLLKEACDRHPLSPAHWLDYGNTSLLSGSYAEAKYAFRQVLAIQPTEMNAITGTMACHLLSDETDSASSCRIEHAAIWQEEEQRTLWRQRKLHQQHHLIREIVTPWGHVWKHCHTQDNFCHTSCATNIACTAYSACIKCLHTALASNHELYYPLLADMADMHFGHHQPEEAIYSLESYETACQHYTGSYDETVKESLSHIVFNIYFYNNHRNSILHHIFHLEEDWLSAAETAVLEKNAAKGRRLLNQHLSQQPILDAFDLYRCAIAFFESGDEISGCHCFQQAYQLHPRLFYHRDEKGRDACTAFAESFAAYFDHIAVHHPTLYQNIEQLIINIEHT